MHHYRALAQLLIIQLISNMGQTHTKIITNQLHFNINEWQQLSNNQYGAKCSNLYMHRKQRLWGELTTVTCGPHQTVEEQLSIYYYRMKQDNALVSVYAVDFHNDTQAPLCGNTKLLTVVYQRIPLRLSEVPPLNLPDSLYVLSEAIRGFKDCYQKAGQFHITAEMIGFNSQGHAKVWLTENFAQNHPAQERISLQVTKADKFMEASHMEQQNMLDNLLDVIEQKTQKDYPMELRAALRQKQTFAEAYCQLERFCEKKDCWIPDRIPLTRYFGEFKGESTHIAFFKSNHHAHEIPKIQSNYITQHATYIPNVIYEYPRKTYLTGPPSANIHQKYVPIEDIIKFTPIIYDEPTYKSTHIFRFNNLPTYHNKTYPHIYHQAPTFNQSVYLTGRPS